MKKISILLILLAIGYKGYSQSQSQVATWLGNVTLNKTPHRDNNLLNESFLLLMNDSTQSHSTIADYTSWLTYKPSRQLPVRDELAALVINKN